MGSSITSALHSLVWPRIIWKRDNPDPDDPAWSEFERDSRDGIRIFGRCLPADGDARGTLFFAHGFTTNGGSYKDFAYRIRQEFHVNVILPDLRHHGRSGDRPPTFGTAESWDLASCLDWAEQNELPRPFLLIGESLGGMAVQRLIVEDARVDAAICIHPPGWPWDAVGKNIAWNLENLTAKFPVSVRKWLAPLKDKSMWIGNLIDKTYGFEILSDGDPCNHTQYPPGNPRILYVFGEEDAYEPAKGHRTWSHFYPDSHAERDVWPDQAPDQKKYFISVPGYRHFPPGPTVFEWDGFWPLLRTFIQPLLK